ncbi:MAG: SUMF1/EgtB/PvdO family nonheme iron enzyme [Candidatus Omnitrophica bacterium]|nr:SUMF1/EgtB/PvdO family nonheme iron enzyme [Candidatus Omnitrophota bacterium]
MDKFLQFILIISILFLSAAWASSQEEPILYDFSGSTVEENGIDIQGPGFNSMPQADVTFGDIPVDNSFEGATDGRGVIIQAQPGEGAMIFAARILKSQSALIRCSIRTDSSFASVYLASIDQGANLFVSTITPMNGVFFENRYRRLSDFFVPPSETGFQPLIQILNTSETEPLTVYIDNFEIYLLQKGQFYNEEFLSGGEEDPDVIMMPPSGPAFPTPTPSPTRVPEQWTPTPTVDSPPMGDAHVVPLDLPEDAAPLKMVRIRAGSFTMGSPLNEIGRDGEKEWPPHQVTISNDFFMGACEVTQGQWESIMGFNPVYEQYGVGPNYPINNVWFDDCVEFCNRLSENEGLIPCYIATGDAFEPWEINWEANGYRIPTEAEWEYACRAGTATRYAHGDATEDSDQCMNTEWHDDYMWYCGNNSRDGNPYGNKEVGLKRPNPWGLYDMHGNVSEYCTDHWEDPYDRGPQVDPRGPVEGFWRVSRDGYWGDFALYCRSAYRDKFQIRHTNLGFRIMRSAVNVQIDFTPTEAPVSTSTPTPIPVSLPTSTPTPVQADSSPTPTVINQTGEDVIIVNLDLPETAKPLTLNRIRAGNYTMGSALDEKGRWPDEWPPHEVAITKDFYLGIYEVTQAQWESVMEDSLANEQFGAGENYPLYYASWHHAARFCNRLSERENRQPVFDEATWTVNWEADGYRLPTEAEWEYACRAGTTTRFSHGDALDSSDYCGFSELHDKFMWYCANNGERGYPEYAKEVGLKLPNPWGLYDMHGNLWEWCMDYWEDPSPRGPQTDPRGPASGYANVARGGDWNLTAQFSRSASRSIYSTGNALTSLGFRIARPYP